MSSYRVPKFKKSSMKSVEVFEGETIEQKIERIMANNEPIKDGAPEIFTERKDGVIAAYNIRTDRWEIAAEAMDVVSKSVQAKRDAKAAEKDVKVVDMEGNEKKNGGAEPIQGEKGAK